MGQRHTAIANIPLMLWFIFSLASHAGAGYDAVQAWMASPLVAIATLLLIYATFYHATLGLQVVIEDYVHNKGTKFAAMIAVKFAFIAMGVASAFAVLKVAFESDGMESYTYIDHEYDVVVLGAGGAGLRATLGSVQAGLEDSLCQSVPDPVAHA